MKILDLLKVEFVLPNIKAQKQLGVFEEMAEKISSELGVDANHLVEALLERERTRPTALERTGVAIPHARIPDTEKFAVLFARSVSGVDFKAEDSQPSHLFFLIVGPENAPGEYLRLLARIARLCHDGDFRDALMKAGDVQDILSLIADRDAKY